MRPLRPRSLFWTFAGAFLLVLVAATVLQAVVVVGVVRPWTRNLLEERAGYVLAGVAARLEELDVPTERSIHRTLLRFGPGPRLGDPEPLPGDPERPDRAGFAVVFRFDDGRVIPGLPLPGPGRGRRGVRWGAGPDSASFPLEPPLRPPFPGRGDPSALIEEGVILGRLPARFGDGSGGEVLAVTRRRPFRLWPESAPLSLLLSLPVALVLSGVAGLVLVRALTRRLRRLEHLAARVSEGDLRARVRDLGPDEIGRLGGRLNRMTGSLEEARARIESGDRQRKQLLADISHELSTPLTSIRGYTETLIDPSVPVSAAERETYLRNVLEEAERMDLLIHDLLELTRLEAGAIPLHRESLDWGELARNTVERFRPRFERAGLEVSWRGGEDPARIEADGRRMEQVLENLLANVLRYVPRGGKVEVSLGRTAEGRFRLEVADDGPGIPAENLPHVFDRFFQADASRSTGGSGLGLAIVKEIVELHQGRVAARASLPRGTVISVELPAG